MAITSVVFDYGQVISFPPDPAVMAELARRAGVERREFEAVLWALRGEYDRGTVTVGDYYRQVLARLGVRLPEEAINEMAELDLKSWRHVNPATVRLMEELKGAGYTLGILSNMPEDFLAWARGHLPVFSLPQVGLFSCELRLIKPEAAIYRELLARTGAKAGELVFFDDNADNISGARALGIAAFLWQGADHARQELASLGVTLAGGAGG